LNDLLPELGRLRWLRLLVLAIVLYLALLPLWWYSLEALAVVAGTAANWIYGIFDARVSIRPDGRIVRVLVSAPPELASFSNSGLRLDTVTYGLPMLAALIIVTRSSSILLKLRALVVGLAIMSAMTLPAVLVWAKLTALQVDDQLAQSGDRSSFLYYAFHGYAFSQPVVAIALWFGMMMLGLFKREEKAAAPLKSPGRNAPCPCGSGRKYKKCCGAD